MGNSTVTPLQGKALLITQLELVIPTTVAGTLYGVAFTLFCLYVHALIPRLRDGDRAKQAKFMLGYSIVLMLCGLYDLVANAWSAQDAYVKHGTYPGGPYAYIISSIFNSPLIPVGFACQLAIDVLTLAIQVWRVWVIWSGTRYATLVIVLPSLGLLTFTGLSLRTIIIETTQHVSKNVQLDTKTQQAEVAIHGATIILCTVLISFYLIFKQRQQRKLIGKNQGAAGYVTVVAMLVESYALESLWLLAVLISWEQSVSVFFHESGDYIEIIAYFLVLYRVARGTAYESQRRPRIISSLRWNHSNRATTQFGEPPAEIQKSHEVAVIPKASGAPRVSSMA